jgi:tetrahydromethanopterin S-methyltransferase subunit F
MEQSNQIMLAQVSLRRDEERRAARFMGLSMGLLFSLIFVLQAISW